MPPGRPATERRGGASRSRPGRERRGYGRRAGDGDEGIVEGIGVANVRRALAVAFGLGLFTLFGIVLMCMHRVASASASVGRTNVAGWTPAEFALNEEMARGHYKLFPTVGDSKALLQATSADEVEALELGAQGGRAQLDAAALVDVGSGIGGGPLFKDASGMAQGSRTAAREDVPPQSAASRDFLAPREPPTPPPILVAAPAPSQKPTMRQPMLLRPGEALPTGTDRAVLVIIAHDKPDCLTRCLDSIAKLRDEDKRAFHFAVSLDDPGSFPQMESAARGFEARLPGLQIWRKTSHSRLQQSVAKISEHFRFALTETFDLRGYEFGVFLETDLTASPDFLWYFRATAWLLREDHSLFCVSAWNDNGSRDLVSDEKRLFRTDYFPGLGWMIEHQTWQQLRPMWPEFPSTGWDHWLRHGSGLDDRSCIVPEVSRSHHFDEAGTNVKAGTPLAKALAKQAEAHLPPESLGDLTYLLHDRYAESLLSMTQGAVAIRGDQLSQTNREQTYLLPYVREEYGGLAKTLQLSAAQPRTAFKGIIITRHPETRARIVLADRRLSESILPVAEMWQPHPGRKVAPASPGESCDMFCGRQSMRCEDKELEFVNECKYMRQNFMCEAGCGHQVGPEIPAYVHDANRDTARQCLVTDDALSTCKASCPATTRLCVCVPH